MPYRNFFERNEAKLCSPINTAPRPLSKPPVSFFTRRRGPSHFYPRIASPSSASRPISLGSVRAALISLLSLSIISAGVFLGAPEQRQCKNLFVRESLVSSRHFCRGKDLKPSIAHVRGE